MAESHEETVKQVLNAEQEDTPKSGLKLFGYVVPWWVVVVVVLLLLYVVYDQGYLTKVTGSMPEKQVGLADTLAGGGMRYNSLDIETPIQMKQLFGL